MSNHDLDQQECNNQTHRYMNTGAGVVLVFSAMVFTTDLISDKFNLTDYFGKNTGKAYATLFIGGGLLGAGLGAGIAGVQQARAGHREPRL